MDLDIRTPMGLMFTLMGAMITIYGAVTSGNTMYGEHSLGININLWWGLALTAFGVCMLVPALLARKSQTHAPHEHKPLEEPPAHGR